MMPGALPLWRLVALIGITLTCFAGNSVLCRLALKQTALDAASFTSLRVLSGALMLCLLAAYRHKGTDDASRPKRGSVPTWFGGNWFSAAALFVYAATLSFAYIDIATGAGALLLFGAVQATMIVAGWWAGERLSVRQWTGFVLALAGMVALLLPGLTAPPLESALLMLVSGAAWGVYSLRGRFGGDPVQGSAGNFGRAALLALALSGLAWSGQRWDGMGAFYALLSGAVTSGLGYAIWYTVLPSLSVTRAATLQLSVPVLASVAGLVFVQEAITLRLVLTSLAVLGGIAMVVLGRQLRRDHG